MNPVFDIKGESHTNPYQRFVIMHAHSEHKKICEDWYIYSEFKQWYIDNHEPNTSFVHIDNVYSSETCGFVSPSLRWVFNHVKPNAGVTPYKDGFGATFRGTTKGPYRTAIAAHIAYLEARDTYIRTIAQHLPAHLRDQVVTSPPEKPVAVQYTPEQDIPLAQGYLAKSSSANSRGIEFALTFDKYRELVNATHCHITGVAFVMHDKSHHHARTLDRINCDAGYTDDNTVAVTKEVNVLKNIIAEQPEGTMSADAFRKLAAFMLANRSITDNMDIRPRNQP